MRILRGASAARWGANKANARRRWGETRFVSRVSLLYGEHMADDRFHLLGVSGSLREKSRTALALRLLLDFAEEHGAETRMLDLRTIELPLYRPHGPRRSPADLRLGAHITSPSGAV